MIAVSSNLRETIEIRRFATQMEEVLSVEYDQNRYPGNYITQGEAEKYNLKMPEVHDDL